MRAGVCLIVFSLPIMLCGQRVWGVHDTYLGPVKSVTIIEQTPADYRTTVLDGAYVREGEPLMRPPTPIDFSKARHYFYDESSKIIRHTLFDKHADTVGICHWRYDNEGRILDRKEFIGSSRLERVLSYEYPSETITIQHSILPSGDTLNTHITEIDTIERTIHNYNVHGDHIENQYITELNEAGDPIRMYSIQGSHKNTITERTYHSSGTLLMTQQSFPVANSIRCKILKYDDQGNLIEERIQYDHGRESLLEYKYDDLGNVKRKDHQSHTRLTQKPIWYEYEFNQYGDWIRKSIFRDTDVNWRYHGETVLREITYY